MAAPIINGKPIRFVGTAGWADKFGGLEGAMYIKEALACLTKHPVDMLVFEVVGETARRKMQIRSAGYDLATDSKLDETTVLMSMSSLPTPTFWLKIDRDEEGNYVGTFLFPDEY
jgi:hypothetical protein